MRNFLQHCFNDGHLYCRLCDLGVSEARAKRWATSLARWIRPLLYGPVKASDQKL
ncbi:hypothetical protein DesfrDRAFT_0058 [Solidesulfovibrio fructosivorans JJ]]|uniref:Uncharacterized protein n=1 Tax=Solidesulfovibrio fructosivorans JJ] TaxID=596151 RepID=E1JR09_SOLFR|nr:hypothetical protein [Solidesulfovibrio fructosivorans]EFL53010.1 hypothetical protein DesfrDRAFT_0058 [Solidesulfovibrio fructosivorans JJ]]